MKSEKRQQFCDDDPHPAESRVVGDAVRIRDKVAWRGVIRHIDHRPVEQIATGALILTHLRLRLPVCDQLAYGRARLSSQSEAQRKITALR